MSNISFNPWPTINAGGTFGTTWDGLMQGTAWPDPAIRNSLAGGRLADTETLPIWGGVGVSLYVPVPQGSPPATPDVMLGPAVFRATNVTGGATAKTLLGFSVFDQNYSALNYPQSPVPLVMSGGNVNFYRLGSGARIIVKADPVLLESLNADPESTPVSWDFAEQMLIPYQAAYAANVITNAVWATDQITFTTTTAHGLSVGSLIEISGFTPAGYNGQYRTVAGTTGSTIVVDNDVDPGSDTVQGQLDAGGGALPCSILRVQETNCMTVVFDADTGFATWDRDGAAAVILI